MDLKIEGTEKDMLKDTIKELYQQKNLKFIEFCQLEIFMILIELIMIKIY